METKRCSMCNEEKSLDNFYSQTYQTKTKGIGITYKPYCKDCGVKKVQQKRKENPDMQKELDRTRYINNPEYFKEKNERYDSDPKNIGKKKQITSIWQKKHPEKIKEYQEKRKQQKDHIISKKEWIGCKFYFNNSCAYCGMTLEDHKKKYNQDLHKDHVDAYGSNFVDNCVPACYSCNSSKRDFPLDEWYNDKNPKYTLERYLKIKKWIEEDHNLYFQGYREKKKYKGKNIINI